MIVTIGTSKGGEGKSTIATNLSAMLATRGKDVLLVDADPQVSSYRWSERRDSELPNLPKVDAVMLEGKIRDKLKALNEKYQYLIVDTPGRASAELVSACLVSDMLLIPLGLGFFNLWGIEPMVAMLENVRLVNESLQCYTVVNRASTHAKINDRAEAEVLIRENPILDNLKAPLLKTVIHERRIIRSASGYGFSVEEIPDRKDLRDAKEKAAGEMHSLYRELFDNVTA